MEAEQKEIQPAVKIQKHILVFGRHDYILTNVQNILQRAEMTSNGFTMLEEMLDYIRMQPLDAVLIGGGVDPHDRMRINQAVKVNAPHARVIEHYGGPATILSEIRAALDQS